jgi:tetratricopeptide (TPR) repeat protein
MYRSRRDQAFARTLALSWLVFLVCPPEVLGARTQVREYERVFTTYPYSDPDPVPAMTRFYPYFRFDGFTDQPVQKKWKVVELSNAYLQILILPEIGGKIWATIEKASGKSFVYFNHVIKFRDISMRGPWTSGGIEPNYGIIGHAPTCCSPVDYLVRHNSDGSASCFVGALDLLTRTSWCLEIKLAPDAACLSTRSFWHNSSSVDQPYYTWMNVGIKAAGNLEFVNPGTHYIYHDGKAYNWPTNLDNGHDLAWYEQNNFGSYKSYHVLGRLSEFFGGYWHDEDFGMAHWSPFGDKPGKKIWIWGLSRQGMIWEKLLTDTDGQYVEVQSGRLFNQADSQSTLSPFKHMEFPPHATDSWTEYWLPVKKIGGFVSASPWGALNVGQSNGCLVLRICPTRPMHDRLELFDGEHLLHGETVNLTPMVPFEQVVPLATAPRALRVCLGGDKLQYAAGNENILNRPLEAPADFDWNSVYGRYIKGKESARQKSYTEAAEQLSLCLKQDPYFVPALIELASLANRNGDSATAADYGRRALSVDTYEPEANYQFGLAQAALANHAEAQAAFGIAALTSGWRSAADTELAKEYLREKRYERALARAEESLEGNPRNLDALQLSACIHRLRGEGPQARKALALALDLNPLNHLARFERCLLEAKGFSEFSSLIRNELPEQTCLELAAWYRNAGLDTEAAQVLRLAPPTAEVLYWLAYLSGDRQLLARAEEASPSFVFPFRGEAIPVFTWAAGQRQSWQAWYYLALIYWHQGELEKARKLLTDCGDKPPFAPFYAVRAQLVDQTSLADLKRAAELAPDQWRYGMMLVKHLLHVNDIAGAMATAKENAQRFPTNDALALLHAKALLLSGDYQGTIERLTPLHLLPSEGTTEARALFHEANLMLAAHRIRDGAFDQALTLIDQARTWPENLGSGKPYPADTDERLEDWLAYQVALNQQHARPARPLLEKIVAFQSSRAGTRDSGAIICALALKELGRSVEAERLLNDWLQAQPNSELAQWGADLLAGRATPLPKTVTDLRARVIYACQNQGPGKPVAR